MEENLIVAGGLVIEVLLVLSVVLAVYLRRSHKLQQQLLARLADKETHSDEAVATPVESPEAAPEVPVLTTEAAPRIEIPPVEAPAPQVAETNSEPAAAPDTSVTGELRQLREIIENANLEDSTERLQQRLDATQQSLQRLAVDLEQESDSGERRVDIKPIQNNLKEMTAEVDSLQQNNAQLQKDLRHKAEDMEQAIAEEQENTDRVLHHAKKLRKDMSQLREKLRNRESDVKELQSANDSLTAEYNALMKEYERIYAGAPK